MFVVIVFFVRREGWWNVGAAALTTMTDILAAIIYFGEFGGSGIGGGGIGGGVIVGDVIGVEAAPLFVFVPLYRCYCYCCCCCYCY